MLRGERKGAGVPETSVGRVRFDEGAVARGGVGCGWKGRSAGSVALLVLFLQRGTRLFDALMALVDVLGPVVGPQVMGMVESLLPQKTASPVPATPTHAEMVARLRELYVSEKRFTWKVEEVKERLEKARAKVFEEEEGMAKVGRELKIRLRLISRRRRKGRKGGEGRRGPAVMIWKTVPSLRRQAALTKLGCVLRLGRG